MERTFKSLKSDLVFYRHMYLVYAILLVCSLGFLISSLIQNGFEFFFWINLVLTVVFCISLVYSLPIKRKEIKYRVERYLLDLHELGGIINKTLTSLHVLDADYDVYIKRGELDKIKEKLHDISITFLEDVNIFTEKTGLEFTPSVINTKNLSSLAETRNCLDDTKEEIKKEIEYISEKKKTIKSYYEKF